MYVRFTDKWQWDIRCLIEAIKSPTIYKIHDGLIYIFYQKLINDDKLINRHDILCYLDYKRIFPIKNQDKNRAGYCVFCNTYKRCDLCVKNSHSYGVCGVCRYTPSPYTNIYINTKFEGLIETVDYILSHQGNYYYFYHRIVKQEDFNYEKIIHQSWYQIQNTKMCDQCHQSQKYYQSWCKPCYDFAYDEIYNQHLCKYELIKTFSIPIELINIMMELYLLILNIPIPLNMTIKAKPLKSQVKLTALEKVKVTAVENVIEELEEDLEEDLITEENMDFYLEDPSYDDELGTWSEES